MSKRVGAAGGVFLAALFIGSLPQLTGGTAAQTAAAKIPRMPDGNSNLQGI